MKFLVIGKSMYAKSLDQVLGLLGPVVRVDSVYDCAHLLARRGDRYSFETTVAFADIKHGTTSEQFFVIREGIFLLRESEFSGQILLMAPDTDMLEKVKEMSIVGDRNPELSMRKTPGLRMVSVAEPLGSIMLWCGRNHMKVCGPQRWRNWVAGAALSEAGQLLGNEHLEDEALLRIRSLFLERINWITALELDSHNPQWPNGFLDALGQLKAAPLANDGWQQQVAELVVAIWRTQNR
jgi:hypothetical protein